MYKVGPAAACPQKVFETNGPGKAKKQYVAVLSDPDYPRLSQSLVIPDENAAEVAALREGLERELKPKGVLEHELVDEITACFWRLRRMRLLEAGVFAQAISWDPEIAKKESISRSRKKDHSGSMKILMEFEPEFDDGDESGDDFETAPESLEEIAEEREESPDEPINFSAEEESCILGRAFKRGEKSLVELTAHAASVERSLYRTLQALEKLQATRGGRSVLAKTFTNL